MSHVKFEIEQIYNVICDYRRKNKRDPEVIYLGTKWFLDVVNEGNEKMRSPYLSVSFYNIEDYENATPDSERVINCYGVRLAYTKNEDTDMYIKPFSKYDLQEFYFEPRFSSTWENVVFKYNDIK